MALIPLAYALRLGGVLALTGAPPNLVVSDGQMAAELPPLNCFATLAEAGRLPSEPQQTVEYKADHRAKRS